MLRGTFNFAHLHKPATLRMQQTQLHNNACVSSVVKLITRAKPCCLVPLKPLRRISFPLALAAVLSHRHWWLDNCVPPATTFREFSFPLVSVSTRLHCSVLWTKLQQDRSYENSHLTVPPSSSMKTSNYPLVRRCPLPPFHFFSTPYLFKEINWLIGKKIPSIYRKQITHLQSGNQTYWELRNRTVVLRQQVQHSHHTEIPIQNSQSHSKCTPLCNISYTTHRLQHPLRKWRHPWKNQ